jgi:hypothetical protein
MVVGWTRLAAGGLVGVGEGGRRWEREEELDLGCWRLLLLVVVGCSSCCGIGREEGRVSMEGWEGRGSGQ